MLDSAANVNIAYSTLHRHIITTHKLPKVGDCRAAEIFARDGMPQIYAQRNKDALPKNIFAAVKF